jgi:hypothetical protein
LTLSDNIKTIAPCYTNMKYISETRKTFLSTKETFYKIMNSSTSSPYAKYKYKIEEILATKYDSSNRAAVIKRITEEKKIITRRRFQTWKKLEKDSKTEILMSHLDAMAVEFGLGKDGRQLIND